VVEPIPKKKSNPRRVLHEYSSLHLSHFVPFKNLMGTVFPSHGLSN
jgi:hypothetical protein